MKYLHSTILCTVVLAACTPTSDQPVIDSFADCVNAGNPVMESFPEQCRTEDGRLFVNEEQTLPPVEEGYTVEAENLRLNNLRPNQAFRSGTITGEAKTWYFEGSFPIAVETAAGDVVVQTFATAQTDWMTTDWVAFEAEVTVPRAVTGEGFIVFKKDNPSGEPALDEEYRLPVVFE